MKSLSIALTSLLGFTLSVAACGDDSSDGDGSNEEEVITTVTLEFTPSGGGATVSASFRDADGDGGNAPVIDPVMLPAGSFSLAVRFLNELETPAEEITEEVADEADEHQVFFTGTAVVGPATTNTTGPLTQAYADTDANGNPIGLDNTITAAAGTGVLTVTLRHLPPVNAVDQKVAGLADDVKTGGISSLPGASDVSVNFNVTVP